jgi:methylmalonyl-CoA/ethylmalonyl-CoA epimerase
MVVDHLGIVVRSLEEGIQHWERLFGYHRSSSIVTNTRQKVRVVFLSKPDSLTIKLIAPSEPASPISAFARKGGGLHHLCFRCDDLKSGIPALQEKGARLIVAPQPGEAFKNKDIAFFLAGNLNVELIDTAEKEGYLESLKHDGSGYLIISPLSGASSPVKT